MSERSESPEPLARQLAREIASHEQTKLEIERLKAELEQRVADRTSALERSNEALQAFSYSISHDLRAPLRAIDGFSQALIEDYADRLDPFGLDCLQRVRHEAQRMGHLMDDLLNLFRVSRVELHRAPVDLSEMARQVGEELKRQEPDRQLEFLVQAGLTTEGDERLLRVVLENLLGNAWKFTAKQSRPRIEFGGTASPDGETMLWVRDNGVGFDMQYAHRLFAPFQRLHTEHEFSGTGIGLVTVQRIVERHGGRVWADAAVGQGASFSFTLQASDAA